MEKLRRVKKQTLKDIGVIETLWWSDIVIMLPNFVGDYPIVWWDRLDNEYFLIKEIYPSLQRY